MFFFGFSFPARRARACARSVHSIPLRNSRNFRKVCALQNLIAAEWKGVQKFVIISASERTCVCPLSAALAHDAMRSEKILSTIQEKGDSILLWHTLACKLRQVHNARCSDPRESWMTWWSENIVLCCRDIVPQNETHAAQRTTDWFCWWTIGLQEWHRCHVRNRSASMSFTINPLIIKTIKWKTTRLP